MVYFNYFILKFIFNKIMKIIMFLKEIVYIIMLINNNVFFFWECYKRYVFLCDIKISNFVFIILMLI